MADSQVDVKDYTGAEVNAIKAIELLKPLEANRHLYNCYNLLGSISKELKNMIGLLVILILLQNILTKLQMRVLERETTLHYKTIWAMFLRNKRCSYKPYLIIKTL